MFEQTIPLEPQDADIVDDFDESRLKTAPPTPERYASWISAYEAKCNNFVRGKCKEATDAMVAEFPELRQACGFVYVAWGRDEHFWCVVKDADENGMAYESAGAIIDPTAAQFPGRAIQYEELNLDDPNDRRRVPTGVCMDCGDPVYGTRFCSSECERATLAYLNSVS